MYHYQSESQFPGFEFVTTIGLLVKAARSLHIRAEVTSSGREVPNSFPLHLIFEFLSDEMAVFQPFVLSTSPDLPALYFEVL